MSPIGNDNLIDANGDPLSGGKINTYLAGSTTPAATYTSSLGVTPQANPVILNTRGVPANPIWLQGGSSYKLVITDSNDVVLQTIDNVQGVNDPSTAATQDEWVLFSGTPTFLSTTSFSVAGDQTPTFQISRRLKTSNAGGTVYSSISNSAFAAGITTVTVVNDSGTLDAGLTAVSYALLSVTNPSLPESTLGKLLRLATAAVARLGLGFEDGGWILYAAAPTYISTTSFSVVGNQTATFQVGRRVKTVNTGGTVYSKISASVFGAVTTVTVVNDSGTLDSGISAVSYGLLAATGPSIPTQTTTDLTASRAKAVTYTNSTGRTIYVVVSGGVTANGAPNMLINGITIGGPQAYALNAVVNMSFAVGAGETYRINDGAGTFTLTSWIETR